MRRGLWALIPLVVLGGLIGVFASRFGHGDDPRFIPSPLIGKPAPQFSLAQLYKPEAKIDNATFAGKVVLFNVFASWCVSCTDEAAGLAWLNRHGVEIYGLDFTDTREAAKTWLKRWGDPYRSIAFDPEGGQAANWGIWGVPETYVIDSHGTIVHKYTGPITPQDARTQVLPLIKRLEGGT